MERKNKTLGWKPERAVKSRSEKIFKDSWAEQTEEWKGKDQTASEASIRSSTLSKTKNLDPLFQNIFPWIPESITVGLDACQIAIFRD